MRKSTLRLCIPPAVTLLAALAILLALVAYPDLAEAAAFTVNSTRDGGDSDVDDGICNDGTGKCTLRAAIQQANFLAGPDTISFNIPGRRAHSIQPNSALPTITDPVTIDGTTQHGFSGTPVIELDGSLVQGLFDNGLHITAGNSTVRGLAINRFGRHGIFIANGDGNVIEGNFLGTDITGTVDLGNFFSGVAVGEGTIGNLIGGSDPGAGNVISGNDLIGVGIADFGTTQNEVQGNLIGTDVTGTAPLGNTFVGVFVANGATDNVIGGTEPGARNVISANGLSGVLIGGDESGVSGNVVAGNFIGTDITGTADLGNSGSGVTVQAGSTDNLIGGTASGEGNTIAFNAQEGVRVFGAGTTGNTIRGNSIHSNDDKGIENISGGNAELAPPTVIAATSASGTACATCTVDVYSDSADEGRVYHGATVADGSGVWRFPGSVIGPNITATATDASDNTSEFSAPFAFINPAVADALAEAGLDPSTVPTEVVDSLTTADQEAVLTVVEAGTTVDQNISLEPDGAVVLGEGSTVTGNIEGGVNNTVVLGDDTTVEGNIVGVGLSFAGGSKVQINGNVVDDQSNEVLVGQGAQVTFGGNLKAAILFIDENGVVTVDGKLEFIISLEMAANASLAVARNLTCDAGATAIIAPSASIIVDRKVKCAVL